MSGDRVMTVTVTFDVVGEVDNRQFGRYLIEMLEIPQADGEGSFTVVGIADVETDSGPFVNVGRLA